MLLMVLIHLGLRIEGQRFGKQIEVGGNGGRRHGHSPENKREGEAPAEPLAIAKKLGRSLAFPKHTGQSTEVIPHLPLEMLAIGEKSFMLRTNSFFERTSHDDDAVDVGGYPGKSIVPGWV